MSDGTDDEVRAEDVKALWLEALNGAPTADVHTRVQALLERVNADSPVVNWGMTDLHALTRSSERPREEVARARLRWLAELEHFESAPDAWMRGYFVNMVSEFAQRFGPERGRAFAARLVRSGVINAGDFPTELRP